MAQSTSKTRTRSPAYPAFNLKDALERAQTLYDKERGHPTLLQTAGTHWGYSGATSQVYQIASALRQYGLVEAQGSGDTRKVKLSELGNRILREERPTQRLEAIRKAALSPRLYEELWKKYGAELPSDESLRSYLKVERDFNDGVVASVIRDYKLTLAFSKLDAGHEPIGEESTEPMDDDEPDDFDGEDESEDEVAPPEKKKQSREQRGTPKDTELGETELLVVRLAGDRTFRVLVTGPKPTRREMDKLMKYIELGLDEYPE